ncbi:hypothetical protein T07_11835 [Trichinella nelsoni]|uniref:Uncharacterized protein n=1 Tax=Trichinella nelsoni TaxID=6336 RepID=A0A0V0RE13_9BILA|nr:hypothetical protein T07_11835 [Trichinella nelsoni]
MASSLASTSTRKGVQRICHAGKIPDKPPVIGCQSQELPDFSHAPRRGPLLDRRRLLWIGTNPMLRHNVAQVVYALSHQLALLRLDLQSHGLQAGQHPFQAFQVLLLCLPEDDNIVEIDEARFPRQPPQRFLHQTLKRRRGVAESERHDAELKESQGCGKRRFLPVSLSDFYLPVARRQIERAEPLGPRQRIQRIVYSRDGLGIDARHSVQTAANRPSSEPALLVNSRGLRLVRLPPCAAFPGLAGPPPPAGLGEGGGVAASPAGPLRSRCGALQGLFVRGRPRRARWPSRISGVCCVGPSYCARNTPFHPLGYVSNHSTHRHRLLRQIPHSVAPPQPRSRCWAGRHFLPLAGTSLSSRLSGPSSET